MKNLRERKVLIFQAAIVGLSIVVYRLFDFEHNELGAFFIFLPLLILSIFSIRLFIRG